MVVPGLSGLTGTPFGGLVGLVEDKTLFEATAILGLRGVIISVGFPILGWVAWKRRTWAPIVGFVIVLLFETGLAGSMKNGNGETVSMGVLASDGRSAIGRIGVPFGSCDKRGCSVGLFGVVLHQSWKHDAKDCVGALSLQHLLS